MVSTVDPAPGATHLERFRSRTNVVPRCPRCRGLLVETHDQARYCAACRNGYPVLAGLLDLRLSTDRYLTIEEERAKALRLVDHDRRTGGDFDSMARFYYEITADVDEKRRLRFLEHLRAAQSRGAKVLESSGIQRGDSVLEVGCGSGGLLAAAAVHGIEVVGLDVGLRWLVMSRKRLAELGVAQPLLAASAEQLPFATATFDHVIADSILEHLEVPERAIAEWYRVLKPGGTLTLWSPNRRSLLTDPHVGLWGVGWLPRRWAVPYVRARRGSIWLPRLYSAVEAVRLFSHDDWTEVGVSSAPLGPDLVSDDRDFTKTILRALPRSRAGSWFDGLARSFGPIWMLSARRAAVR